jgi:cysteinyl-tRNA synthetase
VYDVLVRHLRDSGWDVTFVRNVTDVDDKIIKRAKERGEDPLALSERFHAAYSEDMARLGNLTPDVEPKVSDHIAEVIALVQRLIDKGFAYVSGGDVYFHVPNFAEYGKLSHRKLADMMAGASGRTEEEETTRKQHAFDFALWKGTAPGELSWPSPWGEGRPGWHIECSAMSTKYLGESFDLHGGGLDLVFPHHENEIAQSEAASGQPYVRCWMHNGFVQVNKEKMAKSVGNFFSAREVFERVEPEAMRYALLSMHYRAPFNLEWANDASGQLMGFPQFEEAERRLEYVYGTRQRLAQIPSERLVDDAEPVPDAIARFRERVKEALDDDLNTAVALAHVSDLLNATNQLCDKGMQKKGKASRAAALAAREALEAMARVLGLGADLPASFIERVRNRRARALGIDPAAIRTSIEERTRAREAKDWARSDAIREELSGRGVELFDGPAGTDWRLQVGPSRAEAG